MKRTFLSALMAGLGAVLISSPAVAQKRYDSGANDKEIKIGGVSPYSGPASSYGTIGKGIKAYFDKVNAEGGIAGRQVKPVIVVYDALTDSFVSPAASSGASLAATVDIPAMPDCAWALM